MSQPTTFQTVSGQAVNAPVVKTTNGDYVIASGPDKGRVVFPVRQ